MNMRFKIFICVWAASALAGSVRAEEASGGRVLSWSDCARAALAGNPSLKGQRRQVESYEYKLYSARNQFYPSLNADYSFSRGGNSLANIASDTWGAGLSAQETFFNLQYSADIRGKKATLEQSRATLRSTLADLRYNLLSAFTNLLYAQEKARLMQSIYELRAQNARVVSLQYEGGKESKGNKMRAEALAFQAQKNVDSARRSMDTSRRALAAVLGMDEFEVFSATGSLDGDESLASGDIDSLAQRSPSVLVSRAAVTIAKEQLSYAAANLYPTLSASQSLSWSDNVATPKDRYWSLGATLSLPIFSSGITAYKNNKASAQSLLGKAQEDYRSAVLSAKSSLQTASARLQAAIDDKQSNKLLLAAGLQRHEESSVQYIAGLVNFVNWEQIEQDFVNAETNHLDSLKELNLARANWENLLGVTLGE